MIKQLKKVLILDRNGGRRLNIDTSEGLVHSLQAEPSALARSLWRELNYHCNQNMLDSQLEVIITRGSDVWACCSLTACAEIKLV